MYTDNNDRNYWIYALERIARPVLEALNKRELKKVMPVESRIEGRENFTYLEAFGRTLAGIAPWLELKEASKEELKLIKEYALLSRSAIDAATDPESEDYMNFTGKYGNQPVVDAAFLAHAILRAPTELWEKLDKKVKKNLVAALKSTRSCFVSYNNWLLFAAMIETALFKMGEDWDRMRVDCALRQFEQWYLGDGVYSDGFDFHWDYYNSFVIQPMLLDIIMNIGEQHPNWNKLKEGILKRAIRYAEILERMIAPDGSFVVIGQSMTYRFGAFQHLSQMALQHKLPQAISVAQVRCALTAVIRRVMDAPGTFDENGWLRIGLYGSQPSLGEDYISTGSLYLCSTVFLALGLGPNDEFWSAKPEDWTAKKIWSGQDVNRDCAL